jgi:hypothetical protein
MAKSSDKAREILEYLEKRDRTTNKAGETVESRGFTGVLNRLKRKEYTALQADLAAIIDGTYVEVEETEE